MPSEIYVDKIMDQAGAKSLFEQSGSNWIAGTGVPSGMIVNSKVVENGTRYSISGTTSSDAEMFDFGDYTKLYANTDLFITICIFTFASSDQWTGNLGIKYGGGSTYWAQTYTFNDVAKGQQLTVYAKINGHTTTGSQAISIRYGTEGSGTTRPASIVNPKWDDDDRINNYGKSVAIVNEVQT